MLSAVDKALTAHAKFALDYDPEKVSPRPRLRLAVLTCMDTSLSLQALGLGRQDACLNPHKCEVLTHREWLCARTSNWTTRWMSEAMRYSGARTKKAVVEAGLRLLVQTHSQACMRKLQGKIKWEGDWNESRHSRSSLIPTFPTTLRTASPQASPYPTQPCS